MCLPNVTNVCSRTPLYALTPLLKCVRNKVDCVLRYSSDIYLRRVSKRKLHTSVDFIPGTI